MQLPAEFDWNISLGPQLVLTDGLVGDGNAVRS